MSDNLKNSEANLRVLEERLLKLEQRIAKKQSKQDAKDAAKAVKAARKAKLAIDLKPFDTVSEPRKSLSTFMRNQNKLYVNSINAIDRKAAIMIRVNSTIVSALIIFFEHVQTIQNGIFIGIVLILASFISLMMAINASRPHVFAMIRDYTKNILSKHPNHEEQMFILGANTKVTLEEYNEAFQKIVNSQDLQIGNQVRSMYLFEKQQLRSFTLIELSYIAFMIGFSIAVLGFIIGAIQVNLF